MSGLIKTLVEIARTQKGVDYGVTEIYQTLDNSRERSQTGGDEKLPLKDILGLSDGTEGAGGKA